MKNDILVKSPKPKDSEKHITCGAKCTKNMENLTCPNECNDQ